MSVGEAMLRMTRWASGSMVHFLESSEEVVTNPITGEPVVRSDGTPATYIRTRLNLDSEEAQRHMHLIKKVSNGAYGLSVELYDAKDATDKILQLHGRYKQLPGGGGTENDKVIYRLPDGSAIEF